MEAAFFIGGMDASLCVPTRLSIRNSPLATRPPLNHDDNSRPLESYAHDRAAPRVTGESSHASRSF